MRERTSGADLPDAARLFNQHREFLISVAYRVLGSVTDAEDAVLGSELEIPDEKILALGEYAMSPFYDEKERAALEYADAVTLSDRDVGDDLFERVREHFGDDALVELTAVIAWENSSSKFNRVLRVPSQGLWRRER